MIEVLLRIDEMKIIPRVWPLDDHYEKITSVVEITIAYRWLELLPVLFDPVIQINRRLHPGRDAGLSRLYLRSSEISDETEYFVPRKASTNGRDFGQLAVSRHLISGMDWAIAGFATAVDAAAKLAT